MTANSAFGFENLTDRAPDLLVLAHGRKEMQAQQVNERRKDKNCILEDEIEQNGVQNIKCGLHVQGVSHSSRPVSQNGPQALQVRHYPLCRTCPAGVTHLFAQPPSFTPRISISAHRQLSSMAKSTQPAAKVLTRQRLNDKVAEAKKRHASANKSGRGNDRPGGAPASKKGRKTPDKERIKDLEAALAKANSKPLMTVSMRCRLGADVSRGTGETREAVG